MFIIFKTNVEYFIYFVELHRSHVPEYYIIYEYYNNIKSKQINYIINNRVMKKIYN